MLGVKAVITASYERIHRSNLIGMGVYLKFADGATWQSLDGEETLEIPELSNNKNQDQRSRCTQQEPTGAQELPMRCANRHSVEMQYYRNGGVLPTVLRNLSK